MEYHKNIAPENWMSETCTWGLGKSKPNTNLSPIISRTETRIYKLKTVQNSRQNICKTNNGGKQKDHRERVRPTEKIVKEDLQFNLGKITVEEIKGI